MSRDCLERLDLLYLRVASHSLHFFIYIFLREHAVFLYLALYLFCGVIFSALHFDNLGSVYRHLVELLEQLVTLAALYLVVSAYLGFNLAHRVELEALVVDGVDQFVDPVVKDFDVLLNLLVAQQFREVVI